MNNFLPLQYAVLAFTGNPCLSPLTEMNVLFNSSWERGANPFPPKCDRLDSPLAHAVREGSVNVVKYMLDAIDRKNIPVANIRGELFYAKYKAAHAYAASEGECRGYLFNERFIDHYYWRRQYPCI